MRSNNAKIVSVSLEDKETLRKIGKLVEKNKAKTLNYSDDKLQYIVDKSVDI